MEPVGRITRRNPTGRVPGGSERGSRGSSRGSRGRGRGGQRRTVSDGHVDTESETYWSYEDSTYRPEMEPVETPYEGDDDDVSDEEENGSLARIEALLQQYHREREERRERRMVNHFWEALDLEIRDRATQLPNMTLSQVVAQGLKGEKQWEERKKRDAEEAKKRKWEHHGPQGSNKKGNYGGGGSFKAPAPPSRGGSGTGGQNSGSQAPMVIRCRNCNRNHGGKVS
ncbi:unnamed protein product [Cuscuta epithymum]|uniref:Uncharacterized protein n=1 Tax=Cuscuta epithymum TaxID=186058 RepID=A0AAV0EUC9_9ASTE|nr:unnamed protein product [Cuscuta epithymum]